MWRRVVTLSPAVRNELTPNNRAAVPKKQLRIVKCFSLLVQYLKETESIGTGTVGLVGAANPVSDWGCGARRPAPT